MPQADALSTPACPSAKAAGTLIAAIDRLHAAELGRTPDLDRCGHLSDRLDHAEDALSWSRPHTAEGALAHLCLAFSLADILREVEGEAQADKARRTLSRHLYAVRAYLLAQAGPDLPTALLCDRLIAFYMPDANEDGGSSDV
jgi:hypothetical protein